MTNSEFDNSPKPPSEKPITAVLGSGVTEDNKPTYDSKFRTLALVEHIKKDPSRVAIFSGGKTAGEEYVSEAEAMQQ